MLRAVRNVNQLIVREKDRARLVEGTCACLVEGRGYDAAWFGLLDGAGRASVLSGRGLEDAWGPFAERLERGELPACARAALETDEVVVVEEETPACAACPVRLKRGRHSTMAVRVGHGGRVFGVMAVCLFGDVLIDAQERALVTEIAGDVGFALQSLAAAQALEAETELSNTLLEAMPDALFVGDPVRRRAVRWNRAFREISGYGDEEIAALPAGESYFDAADLARLCGAGPGSPGADGKCEAALLTKEGQRVDTEWVIASVPRVAGEAPLVLGIGRDISDRKRVQARLAQSDRLATMGLLAAGVAHEINNPLAYVLYNLESAGEELLGLASTVRECHAAISKRLGHAEWERLMGSHLDRLGPVALDDLGERFQEALSGARRIRDISRGLTTFARADEERSVEVDLRRVIEAAINMSFNEIRFRARLVKDYGAVSPITANDGKLAQVFLNLLVNAAHAIEDGDPERNEIRVRTWREEDEVCAEVRDTGRGIGPEVLPRVFEPFFSTKEVGVGTGLGLAISKSIVEAAGGAIGVRSELGVGTSFWLRFPIRDPEAGAPSEAEARAPTLPKGPRGRVLVVDDEPGVRKMIGRMLAGEHALVDAESGRRAREIIEADPAFDVILCDLMMPGVSGIELHTWLAAEHPDLARRVVFMTGGVFTASARTYLAGVPNVRIEKPFDTAGTRALVSELVRAARGVPPGAGGASP